VCFKATVAIAYACNVLQ